MGRVTLDVDDEEDVVSAAAANTIPTDQLQPNPENPRLTENEVQETADDLRMRGQLQNINIMSREAFLREKPYLESQCDSAPYVVINGCRRLAGARLGGVSRLRYELHNEWSAIDIDGAAIAENDHRVQLNPLLVGRHLERMSAHFSSARQLAAFLTKPPAWVNQRLALTQLHPDLQKAIEDDQLTFKIARECSRLHPDLQPLLASGELSEELAREWLVVRRIKPDEQLRLWKAGPPYLPQEQEFPTAPDGGEYPVSTPTPTPGTSEPEPSAGDDSASESEYPVLTSPPETSDGGVTARLTIKADRSPSSLAHALRQHLSDQEIHALIQELSTE